MEYILNITDWNVILYWHNVLIIGNWTHSQVCSIMLVKTTQYKSSGISSANLLRALEIFDLPPAISPELNKCPGSNPVHNDVRTEKILNDLPFYVYSLEPLWARILNTQIKEDAESQRQDFHTEYGMFSLWFNELWATVHWLSSDLL